MKNTDLLITLFIVFVVVFVLVSALFACVGIYVLASIARRKRSQIYERLTQNLSTTGEPFECIPVRYACAGRFASWLKLFPWELCGILCIRDQRATFFTTFSSWPDLSFTFDQSTSQVSWLGRRLWRNGGLSWVVISNAGTNHYFTSETGISIFGSKKTSEELYEKLQEGLNYSQPTKK